MCRATMENLPKVYEEKDARARVRMSCHECGQWIPPGQIYCRVKGLWDGQWDQFRLCRWCEIRKEWLGQECQAWQFLEIVEDFESHFPTKAESLRVVFEKLGCLAERVPSAT